MSRHQGGIKIEVKSSGYLQSWQQTRPSKIVFSGLMARRWSAETGYGATPEVRADVFVFAVHTCQDPTANDPLDLEAWQFYVLPATIIRQVDQKSLSLGRVRSLAPDRVGWMGVKQAVVVTAG